jgi:hypothetical protein
MTLGSKVVAFAQWKYPAPSSRQQKLGIEEIALPDGTNLAFAEGVFELYRELAKKYYNVNTMYCEILKS